MTGWRWFGTPEGAAALLWNEHGDCPHRRPITLADGRRWHERPWDCSQCEIDLIRTAVEIEREAVVADLREDAEWMDPDGPGAARLHNAADRIAKGDHR